MEKPFIVDKPIIAINKCPKCGRDVQPEAVELWGNGTPKTSVVKCDCGFYSKDNVRCGRCGEYHMPDHCTKDWMI